MNENIDRKAINLIQYKFFQESNELIDEIDRNRVMTDDWQTMRFLIEHKDIDRAFNALIKAMVWRKEFGIHNRNDHYFPKEFYEASESDQTGRDRDGHYVYWSNINAYRFGKITETNLLFKQFVAHLNEKCDKKVHKSGLLFVADLKKASFGNLGFEMIIFNIESNQYYSQLLRLKAIIGMPAVLNPIVKTILSLCGPKLTKYNVFIEREDLLNYMTADIIPKEYGGQRPFRPNVPLNTRTLRELNGIHFNISDRVIEKFYKIYDKIVK